MDEGHQRGVSEGYERGIDDGRKRGKQEGFDEAREQAIRSSISMLKSIGMPDDKAAALIAKNYSIQQEEISDILKKYK